MQVCVTRIQQLEKDNSYLINKVDDLENRSRCSNLRFVGVQNSWQWYYWLYVPADFKAFGTRQLFHSADHWMGSLLSNSSSKRQSQSQTFFDILACCVFLLMVNSNVSAATKMLKLFICHLRSLQDNDCLRWGWCLNLRITVN